VNGGLQPTTPSPLVATTDCRPTEARRLGAAAIVILLAVTTAAATVQLAALASARLDGRVWLGFAALAAAAAAAQVFVVNTSRNHGYHTTAAFLIAAVLVLPWWAVVLIPLVQHAAEWLRERYRWYIQLFNIANFTLDLALACAVFHAIATSTTPAGSARFALAAVAACVTFVAANHGLLAVMLRVGRGHRVSATGLFSFGSLATELGLAALGVLVALTWWSNPWLVAAAVAPLVLVHRSLVVPVLEERTRADPKTGLANAPHFIETLEVQLARASGRFGRPLSVIVADIDHFRDLNNAHGHLAGDAILAGIADILRRELREHDLAARFGGEEFTVLLPGARALDAWEVAERIRRAVHATRFDVATVDWPIAVTISCGVATCPEHASDATALLHRADAALYEAKARGRNETVLAPLPEAPIVAELQVVT
jgi:diguanylate cyclase (GGDEF)-like protein